MFERAILAHNNDVLPGYPILGRIHHAMGISGNHPLIQNAFDTLVQRGYNLHHFTSDMLVDVWTPDEVPMTTKILVTLWWGNVNYLVCNRVYSGVNMDLLQQVAPVLENRLSALSSESNNALFKSGLKNLFVDLCAGGLHLDGVSVSFFTKFFFFWFRSHPIVSIPGFLPVICDRWLAKAVYADMVVRRDCARVEVFKKKGEEVSLRGNLSKSYWAFCDYFNNRARRLNISPVDLERILFSDASRGIMDEIISEETESFFLPSWVAGRSDDDCKVAILFNNLTGQNYLFEEESASVIGTILAYEYWACMKPADVAEMTGLPTEDIKAFFEELQEEYLVMNRPLRNAEIQKIRTFSRNNKRNTIRQAGGVEHLPSIFETVEMDYREKTKYKGIPSNVSFELTYGCNERCIHCYNPCSPREDGIAKKVGKGELGLEDYKKVLDDLTEMGVPNILFTGGDPFVKKEFLEVLKYAHEKKFAISIYTNGQVMADHPEIYDVVKGLYPHSVGLSIYSMDHTIHESITRIPRSLAKTVSVARKLSRDGVTIQIKCPIMKINREGYARVRAFASKLGAVPEFEVNITSGVDGDKYASENLRLSETEMRRILLDPIIPLSPRRQVLERMIDRTPEMLFCGAGLNSVNITPTGDVYPCISFPMKCGNVQKSCISDIWENSEELQRVRSLKYGMSDRCGKESYCKLCNRCIGQSFVEHGTPENKSEDNCFIARIREDLYKSKDVSAS